MRNNFFVAILLLSFARAFAAGISACPQDVTSWLTVDIPPANTAARENWENKAGNSLLEWRVVQNGNKVFAKVLSKDSSAMGAAPLPNFTPKTQRFSRVKAIAHVEDGWLVGFNHGEWGASLYWFSKDGESHYHVSTHKIIDLLPLGDGVVGIEGLEHLGASSGSVIRIVRTASDGRWRVASERALPSAPHAIVNLMDGTAVVVLSDSIIKIEMEVYKILNVDSIWGRLSANSAALSADEHLLYVGMRSYISEFDLDSKGYRVLTPPVPDTTCAP